MPPTPLKARARGLRTLAIAWVRGVLGCNDFSAGATKHAWRPSPSPSPLPLPVWEEGGAWGLERKNAGNPSRKNRMGTVHA